MTALAYGLTSYPSSLVPKSELLHRLEVQYGFVPKLSRHRGKTPPFGLKKLLRAPLNAQPVLSDSGVFPRMMSIVA